MKKKSSITTIVAIGIGAALFFVLGKFVAIPSPIPNTNISIQYGLLAFMSAIFGPVAGALIGFFGHSFIDMSFGWGVWWSWVIASAIDGLIMGLLMKSINIEKKLTGFDIFKFNIAQVIANAFSWFVVAPVLDILVYAEPANKVFTQGLVGGISNIITTAIVGTLLSVAYSAAKPKAGSLKKEK